MQFMVSVIDDRTNSGTPEERAAIDVFNQRLIDEGHWVFAGGLDAPAAATTIDHRGVRPLLVDGPFVETKEHLAGFWILEAADLDTALALATEASRVCNRKIEVRPFLEG